MRIAPGPSLVGRGLRSTVTGQYCHSHTGRVARSCPSPSQGSKLVAREGLSHCEWALRLSQPPWDDHFWCSPHDGLPQCEYCPSSSCDVTACCELSTELERRCGGAHQQTTATRIGLGSDRRASANCTLEFRSELLFQYFDSPSRHIATSR